MSFTNPSQVLLRNLELLTAKTPLFINMPEDGFVDAYLALEQNSESQVSCYNNNFIDYQDLQQKHSNNNAVSCVFSSEYKSQLQHDLVIIAFPKSKAELAFTFAMINHSLCDNAQVILVGENKSGIKSCAKLTTNVLTFCNKVDSARHCSLFTGLFNNQRQTFNLNDWFKRYQISLGDTALTIASLPGVFSQQKLDIGTALLLKNLPNDMKGNILDFGCGAGVISSFIGKKYSNIELNLLDVSALALTSAKETLALNDLSGKVFASNSLSHVEGKFDHIVSNPPFHQGIKTHYQATEEFLKGIKQHTKKQGYITIVANSFLRYKPIMEQSIGTTQIVTNKQGFAIYSCKVK